MPPQESNSMEQASSNSQEEVVAPPAVPSEEAVATGATVSYWDAPPERKLEGKTLSTMDISMLSKDEHHSEEKEEDTPEKESKPSGGGYWEWQENIRKSLSKLTLTEMFFQHPETHSESDKPNTILQADKSTTTSDDGGDATTATTTNESTTSGSPMPSRPSYWFWRNPSMQNLSSASLTSLENAAKTSDEHQATAAAVSAATNANTDGFWFWRNPSMKNMATDSNVSLETLEKTARESDRMQGTTPSATRTSTTTAGPISNLQHKLRSSWRKSFQQLSSNSLSRLDETNGGSDTAWKQIFSSGRSRQDSFSFSVREEDAGGEEGAMTF